MSDQPERIDLGEFPIITSEQIAPGEVWMGPRDSDPLKAFGPGTTKGGRAEAGWLEIGTVADDGITFKPHDLT